MNRLGEIADAVSSQSQPPAPEESPPLGSVEVTNFPAVQDVAVTNFPAIQPVSAATLPLPTGAATQATLSTRLSESAFEARINTPGQKPMANSTPVVIASDQSAVPISAVSLPLPTGAATEDSVATRLSDATFTARVNTPGQKTMAESTPVVLASNQTLACPTGAATETTLLEKLTTAEFQARINTPGQKIMANSTPVVIASDQSPVLIQASSLPLPTGALTDATLQARVNTLGQKTMANSTPVVIASDQVLTVGNYSGGALQIVSNGGFYGCQQSGTWTVQPGNTPNTVPWFVANDWRLNAVPKRYSLMSIIPGALALNTNVLGLRKLNANPDVYIIRIRVHVYHVGAGVATTLAWRRATSVAAGVQIAAVDIPKLDTSAPNATLEVRQGATVTGVKAGQYFLTHPAHTTAAPASGVGCPWIDEWVAPDKGGRIRLTGDEGIILDQQVAGDVDNRYHVLVEWEEA